MLVQDNKFKVGDRVIIVGDGDKNWHEIYPGDTGTVCGFAESMLDKYLVGVEFDKIIKYGHNCNGQTGRGRGLWIRTSNLKHLKRIISVQDWIKNKRNNDERRNQKNYGWDKKLG